ncbi:hypothetical protein M422DRAFT_32539 [Sphaerobolus stellatus SS14]|uniref:HhH-GPD domain-containing protein n=1 Tax=Sphaerobolus stellatus (strain SS14) TaxID=990650 RepID=A0A0C9UYL4_SPHS4|nr:hypothetical protein M422DRAFT_32539 [Sphaerobolus stellatus SS14]
MPITRSARALSNIASSAANAAKSQSLSSNASPRASPSKTKRKAEDQTTSEMESSSEAIAKKPRTLSAPIPPPPSNDLLPAVLPFSFESAKQHLIDVDVRFKDIFNRLPCRPFEHLETVDPFRTLVTSILGQQISWLAARSITHRFIRLYFPHLPEKLPPHNSGEPKVPQEYFPTASQVAETDVLVLKTAGLSTRKAEYVKDLASRFADGRLSNAKLAEADDEELARLLIEVRGIGRWTVDMFAIFSLRRPDILPVGDLGVQRGILRWFLALHSPNDAITISPKKLPKNPGNVSDDEATDKANPSIVDTAAGPLPKETMESAGAEASSLPPVPSTPIRLKHKGIASVPETPNASPAKNGLDTGSLAVFPEPFTPSINKTLRGETSQSATPEKPKLPEGLSVSVLKSRLTGKKIKGAFLTPKEMEELTAPWRPYRSLGVFYMWALAEEPSK